MPVSTGDAYVLLALVSCTDFAQNARALCSQVKWRVEQWFPGTVTGYDPAKGQHCVSYDDGDFRRYVMETKTWRLITARTLV